MYRLKWITALLALAFVMAAGSLSAQGNGKSPKDRRNELRPARHALKNDPEFQRLNARLKGPNTDPKHLEEYLAYLPLSPVDMLEIDMEDARFELMVPRFLVEWQTQWIELHETKARALYGDLFVDQELKRAFSAIKDELAEKQELAGPVKTITVGTNRNAAATVSPAPEDYQGEIQLKVNPNNANQIVAAANTWDGINGTCESGIQAVFYSSDGGATWGYTCPPSTASYSGLTCNDFEFGSDPAIEWNDSNEVFLEYMLLCTPDGSNVSYSIVVSKSTNGGASWSGQGVVINSYSSGNLEDKEFLAIDNNSGSPFNGRMYTCWDRNNNEKFAYSTNGGSSWTEVDLPTSSGTGSGSRFDLGCDIAVEDDGTVHVVFNTLSCGATCNNEEMFYTTSTNGGASWSTPLKIHDFNLVGFSNNNCADAQDNRCISGFGTIAVDNSGGSCDGPLYATFSDYSGGGEDVNDTDVWVVRSTNGGTSWGSAVKVNDDGLANRAQFHPYMEVDQGYGQLVVGWHDARNDSGNDAIDYYVTRSTDCGVSFETNTQVSQASSEFNNSSISYSDANTTDNPNANPNQYGEYMGVDALNCKAYLGWSDTRHFYPGSTTESQAENMGFAVVDFDCAPQTCGNGSIDTGEDCDGSNLNGASCVSLGFASGTLACTGACTFDTSSCVPVNNCGNGVIDSGEVCDGSALGGETCASQGFSGGGTLACNSTCDGFDTSSCVPGSCSTATLYSNDFDSTSGLSDWIRGSFGTGNTNVWRGVQNCSAASSPNIFRFGGTSCTRNYSSNRFIYAQPNGNTGISVPSGSSDTTLTFNHRRQFETGYDGGLVAVSLDNTNYTVVPASAISGANYDGTVNAACAPSGSAGLPIYTGTQSSFVGTTIDLDAVCDLITSGSGGCAGQTLYIAFTGIADCSTTRDGWFLDDVDVTACTP